MNKIKYLLVMNLIFSIIVFADTQDDGFSYYCTAKVEETHAGRLYQQSKSAFGTNLKDTIEEAFDALFDSKMETVSPWNLPFQCINYGEVLRENTKKKWSWDIYRGEGYYKDGLSRKSGTCSWTCRGI